MKQKNLFQDEAERIVRDEDVEAVRLCLIARMNNAGLRYLSDGADKIFEIFVELAGNFDGSEYQQGRKDGLRIALSLLRDPKWADFNRGKGGARETE